jgi:hypothetical protein
VIPDGAGGRWLLRLMQSRHGLLRLEGWSWAEYA